MHGVEASLAAADALPAADQAGKRQLRGPGAAHDPSASSGGGGSSTGSCPSTSRADWDAAARLQPGPPRPTRSVRMGRRRGISSSGPAWLCIFRSGRVAFPADLSGRRAAAILGRGGGRGRSCGDPVHRRLGGPRRRRRPHALGPLRGDRGRLRFRRGHRRRRLPDLRRATGGTSASGCSPTRQPGAGTTSSRPTGRWRPAPGPASRTRTTWPRCCCSTAGPCAGASPPPSADRAHPPLRPAPAPLPTYRASVTQLLSLSDARFVSLTTFRGSGERVSTPVWIGRDGGTLSSCSRPPGAGRSGGCAGTPRVELAPCGRFGRGRRPESCRFPGTADVRETPDDVGRARATIRRHYPIESRLVLGIERLDRTTARTPADGAARAADHLNGVLTRAYVWAAVRG